MLKLMKAIIPNGIKAPIRNKLFKKEGGSSAYWERRYAGGGTSGDGSYGKLAEFKADVVKAFIKEHDIKSVVELGSGDGNQASLMFDGLSVSYLGLDVSQTAIAMCIDRFKDDKNKDFVLFDAMHATNKQGFIKADMALSLDVIFHLVEDDVYGKYMDMLFTLAKRYVVIYSSNHEEEYSRALGPHGRSRRFTDYVGDKQPRWGLIQHIPNKYPVSNDPEGSGSDFYIYQLE